MLVLVADAHVYVGWSRLRVTVLSRAQHTITPTLVLTTGLITIFILVISVIGSVRVHVSSISVMVCRARAH